MDNNFEGENYEGVIENPVPVLEPINEPVVEPISVPQENTVDPISDNNVRPANEDNEPSIPNNDYRDLMNQDGLTLTAGGGVERIQTQEDPFAYKDQIHDDEKARLQALRDELVNQIEPQEYGQDDNNKGFGM